MISIIRPTVTVLALAALLAGCSTDPPDRSGPAPVGQANHHWTAATEAEVAADLDKKFQDAAKHFVKLKKDDQLMYCRRYRMIGSNIPTIQCITEAQLRKQVEDSDQMRDNMRQRMGKCTLAGTATACSAGQ